MPAPFPTKVDLQYQATPVGPTSLAKLLAALNSVPLNLDALTLLGLTLISDTPSVVGGNAARDLLFSVLPPFSTFSPKTVPGTFRGSVVSSNPNDSYPDGTGARTLRIAFTDQKGLPQAEFVNLNGTTPVNLGDPTKKTITAIALSSVGSLGINGGLITIFTGPDGTGTPVSELLGDFQGSILSTSSNDNGGGIGAQSVKITYFDKLGAGPFTETVILNGTTPVDLALFNHATITKMELVSVGVYGSSTGIITLFTGNGGKGARIAQLGASFFQGFPQKTVIAPAIDFKGNEAFVPDPVTGQPIPIPPNAGQTVAADIATPFRDMFTHTLGAALASLVIAVEPAFS